MNKQTFIGRYNREEGKIAVYKLLGLSAAIRMKTPLEASCTMAHCEDIPCL